MLDEAAFLFSKERLTPYNNCRYIVFRLLHSLQFYRYIILTVKKCTCRQRERQKEKERGRKRKREGEEQNKNLHITETIFKTQKLKEDRGAREAGQISVAIHTSIPRVSVS